MKPFRRLFSYANRYRRAFATGLACIVFTTSITIGKLTAYGTALLTIGIVGGVFTFFMRGVLMGASREIEYDMRNEFFAHLERLPLGYFQSHRTGDLMSRATNDLSAVRVMVGPAITLFRGLLPTASATDASS